MAYFTFDDVVRRESLLDVIRDVSPAANNYLVDNLGTSTALNVLHEWPIYNITRPTSVTTAAEGFDVTENVLTGPSRSQNITAVLQRYVRVSGTERATTPAGTGDPMTWQKKNALTRLKADMEFLTLNGTGLVSGASGTARNMAGVNNVISTNLTARNSGTSMSVTELEDIMQNSWDAVSDGNVANIILCPMGIKRKIAGFAGRVTVYQESATNIYNNVIMYESSSGPVKIVPHKDVINATGSTHVFALNEDMYRIAFLKGREPFWKDLGPTGDSDRGVYITEMTLESLAERASVKRFGYNLNG